jgi:2',3'-cyclic-nucleotide 2'-phosphodiesterase (5'-nucleotidase family)
MLLPGGVSAAAVSLGRMKRLVLLHTNDIHGNVDGLARVATLVERECEEAAGAAVLYSMPGTSKTRRTS